MPVMSMRNATVTLQDGSSTPKTCIIQFGDGNFNFNEQVTREYMLSRGLLSSVRNGDDVPMDVSFQGRWEYITSGSGATTPTIREALYQEGAASNWVSTEDDVCQPYCVDIVLEHDPGCGVGAGAPALPIETITFPKFRYEKVGFDGKNATVDVSGKCNVTKATILRTAS